MNKYCLAYFPFKFFLKCTWSSLGIYFQNLSICPKHTTKKSPSPAPGAETSDTNENVPLLSRQPYTCHWLLCKGHANWCLVVKITTIWKLVDLSHSNCNVIPTGVSSDKFNKFSCGCYSKYNAVNRWLACPLHKWKVLGFQ